VAADGTLRISDRPCHTFRHRLGEATVSARFIVITGVVATLALSACGGTSKADFAKQADPVCSTANGELGTVTKPANYQQLGEMSSKVSASVDKQVTALRELDQPKDDKSDLETVLGAMDATVVAARKVASGVTTDDGKAVEDGAGELRQAAIKADDGARAYGLLQCGKGARDAATNLADGANPLLKQRLLTKADAICKDVGAKLDALPETPDSRQGLIRSINEGLPILEKAFTDLKALHAAQPDKPTYDEFLTANDRLVDAARDLRAAAQANDPTRAKAADAAATAANEESDRKATAIGLKECVSTG